MEIVDDVVSRGGTRGADVIVVGGGVIGCAVAYTLASEGASVRLLERDDLAQSASGAAAGMLAPVGEASESGAFLRWAVRSLELFPELCAALHEYSGIDAEFEASGLLRVALGDEQAALLRARAEQLAAASAELGLALAWLGADDARAAEPGLSPAVAGALWSPRDAHVRSPLLTRAYARAAAALGAQIETGVLVRGLLFAREQIRGVRCADGDRAAENVVLCTGCWAGELSGWLDLAGVAPVRVPVEPVRGQILSLTGARPPLRSIVWGEGAYLVPKRDGSLVVGATEERVGYDCRVTAEGVEGLLAAARELVPPLARAEFARGWAGLRPASPDGMPAISAVAGAAGLYVAVGHSRNGVLLSPITGRLVADLVLGKELPPDAAAFDLARFG